jgi:hypothetical protein
MPLDIQPAAPAPAAPVEQPPVGDAFQIPAVGALLAGSPPAVSMDIKAMSGTPESRSIAKALPELMQAGLGLYKAKDGKTGVLFNQTRLHPQAVKAADKAGKLSEIAPSFEQVTAKLAELGPEGHPALTAEPPTGIAPPPGPESPTPPQLATGMVPPAPVSKTMRSARVNAVQPGSPTSGPKPGAGRVINTLQKRVV